MTSATSSFGTEFKIDDGSGTYVTVGEVKDIDFGGPVRETEEVTTHESPGRFRERVSTLRDGDTVTFTINWDPQDSTHDDTDGLLSHLNADDAKTYRVVFPTTNNKTWEFDGFVNSFPPDAPVEGVLETEVEIELTGQPDFDFTST